MSFSANLKIWKCKENDGVLTTEVQIIVQIIDEEGRPT